MRPYSSCAFGLRVGEDRSGGLRKRAPRLSRSCAVHPWLGFRHLRFAAPAQAALPASHGGAFGRARHPGPVARRRRRGLGQSGYPPCSGSAGAIRSAGAITGSERRLAWAARAAVANLRCSKPKHLPQAYVPPNLRTGLPRPPEQSTPIAVGESGRCPLQRLVVAEKRTRLGAGA
jgi:hypothetical protein